jgi:hypothetical protein
MVLRLERDALHFLRGHAVDAVELREVGVDERVVAREQVDHRAVLCAQVVAKRGGFLAHRLFELVVERRVKLCAGPRRADAVRAEPAQEKVVRERLRARVGKHPLHLSFERGRLRKLVLFREREQLVVGNRRPEEKREPGRQLDVIHFRGGDHRAGRGFRRRPIFFDSEKKVRRD